MTDVKLRARLVMSKAIRDGSLIRQPCERCGHPKTDGHHEDYSKPLDVIWLCRRCHLQHHRKYIGGERITFSVSRELLDAIDAQRLIPTGGTERARAKIVRDALTLGLPKLLATLQQERRTDGQD